MSEELDGKVAVVTGGASGLGAGLVRRFVAEGARVVIGDVEAERGAELVAELGGKAVFLRSDVTDVEQISALVDTAVHTFGGLHVMVNNAGVSGTMHRRFLDDDLADFDAVMRINVRAATRSPRSRPARPAARRRAAGSPL